MADVALYASAVGVCSGLVGLVSGVACGRLWLAGVAASTGAANAALFVYVLSERACGC